MREKQSILVENLHQEKSKLDQLGSIEEIINNFKLTLEANPAFEAVIKPQMEAKVSERDKLLVVYLNSIEDDEIALGLSPDQASQKLIKLEEILSNLQTTLEVNPALEGIIKPQIDAREKERSALLAVTDSNSSLKELPLTKKNLQLAMKNFKKRLRVARAK